MNIKTKRLVNSLTSYHSRELDELKQCIEDCNGNIESLSSRISEAEEVNTVLIDENNARIASHAQTVVEMAKKAATFRSQQKMNICFIVVLAVAVVLITFGQ